jgi:transcriptional regulator with XRE-family HTH domain
MKLPPWQPWTMAKTSNTRRSRNSVFLREWRAFRGLTQIEAAERIGIDQSTIAKLELGKLPYNEDILDRIAFAYGCEPSDLLTNNPLRPDAPRLVYDRLKAAPKELQERALAVLEALLKAG